MRQFIAKLFGRSAKEAEKTLPITSELHTRPLPQIELDELERETPSPPPLQPAQFSTASAQSVGLQREHNEDALFSMAVVLAGATTDLPCGLFAVADGMGGHRHGEIASDVAIRTFTTAVLRNLFLSIISPHPASPDESIQEILQHAIQEAHALIKKEVPGGGTTLTAILALGDRMTIAHVGDSRAYAITPEGEARLLTRDHSLVKRLTELGQITAEEAAEHPQRNVLYRALGQGDSFEADVSSLPLPEEGWLLICSDGLWGVISEQQISEMVTTSPTLQEACRRMVEAANLEGGPDNISVVLVQMPQ